MKALHIMYVCGVRGTGGAAAAATRLHLDMLRKGVDSRVACVWGNGAVGNVKVLRTWWWWLGVRILHALTRRWTHGLDLPGFDRMVAEFSPDEIHVHWIRRDTISWRQLGRMRNSEWGMENEGGHVPGLFVHLHDLWPLEQRQITSLKPTFVAYSDFVAHEVRRRGYRVERHELILDPVFASRTYRRPRADGKVILFGCNDGRANPDKGFSDLAAALALLPDEFKAKMELRIFGEGSSGAPEETAGVRTVLLGRIDNPEKLKKEYCEASCFAFPSTNETMGMTKLEALACGCPVVAFNRTACAEGIEHLKTGYVARDGDLADFAEGLKWACNSI